MRNKFKIRSQRDYLEVKGYFSGEYIQGIVYIEYNNRMLFYMQ